MAEFLMITRTGREGLFRQWLGKGNRNFDLLISCYDGDMLVPIEPGVFVEHRPGPKVKGYSDIIEDHHDRLEAYKFIAFFDDDIDASVETINGLFECCQAHNFRISQPALTHNSYFSYAITLQHRLSTLRTTNFIEMMCPVFRLDHLESVRSIFASGFESGIDVVWTHIGEGGERSFAIIDSFPVRHCNPVGAKMDRNGFNQAEGYQKTITECLAAYKIPWINALPFSTLTKNGKWRNDRAFAIFNSISIGGAVFFRGEIRVRMRALLVHWRHLFTRKAKLIRLQTH